MFVLLCLRKDLLGLHDPIQNVPSVTRITSRIRYVPQESQFLQGNIETICYLDARTQWNHVLFNICAYYARRKHNDSNVVRDMTLEETLFSHLLLVVFGRTKYFWIIQWCRQFDQRVLVNVVNVFIDPNCPDTTQVNKINITCFSIVYIIFCWSSIFVIKK